MRTTLTLDDDVAVALRRLCEADGLAFKQAVNSVLRAGIVARASQKPLSPGTAWTTPSDVGQPRLLNIDDIHETLRIGEGDDYR